MYNANEKSGNIFEETSNEILTRFKMDIFTRLISKISKFNIITNNINFTDIPDDVILIILNSKGIPCKQISEMESISCDEINEPGKYGIRLKIIWSTMINPIEIDWVVSYNFSEYEYHKYGESYKEDVY